MRLEGITDEREQQASYYSHPYEPIIYGQTKGFICRLQDVGIEEQQKKISKTNQYGA